MISAGLFYPTNLGCAGEKGNELDAEINANDSQFQLNAYVYDFIRFARPTFSSASPVVPFALLSISVAALFPTGALADEHLFGWVLDAETLPGNHTEAYEFLNQ